ncbi:hypothetical protein Rhopal_004833-T1 [Rhodotorula paludigena]|uniref:Uncharacterized protein n=1 Tax=Rhodotorula paludigena TaxID=86838 RepID=A0AAV5GPJ7_9BASI|nr:hypothetical protein Rhopal_004833-T1 [Rhodotorula paludigena]
MAESHAAAAAALVLPAPPPPPDAAVSRPASIASTATVTPSTAVDGLKEVSVDDLARELHDLTTLVSTASTDLSSLLSLRDRVISSGPLCDPSTLSLLSRSTTSLGSQLVALAPTLRTTAQRLARLSALAHAGTIAALPSELAPLSEQLAVARVEARALLERVRSAAWDEVDARESTKRRVEERVRVENPALGDEGVEMAVRTAFVGAQARVADLDVLSYAGRVALENPATELAQLMDEADDETKAAFAPEADLARTASLHSTTTTLVDPFADPTGGYGKLEGEAGVDEDRQLLARMNTSSTMHGGGAAAGGAGDLEAALADAGGKRKMGKWDNLKLNWRNYLQRKDAEAKESYASSASAAAAATAAASAGA